MTISQLKSNSYLFVNNKVMQDVEITLYAMASYAMTMENIRTSCDPETRSFPSRVRAFSPDNVVEFQSTSPSDMFNFTCVSDSAPLAKEMTESMVVAGISWNLVGRMQELA